MRKFVLAIAILFGLAAPAGAQTVTVDLRTAVLSWTFTQGTSLATEFRMKCGPDAANLNRITTISDVNLRQILIRNVIGGSGLWSCQIVAANKFGETGGSNIVPFDAGEPPSSSPSSLSALAK